MLKSMKGSLTELGGHVSVENICIEEVLDKHLKVMEPYGRGACPPILHPLVPAKLFNFWSYIQPTRAAQLSTIVLVSSPNIKTFNCED